MATKKGTTKKNRAGFGLKPPTGKRTAGAKKKGAKKK